MTIEELNALNEAADYGNQGNYKAPTTTSNIDLTAPVAGLPAIQPYILPIIENQGGGKGPTEDPPIDPMSFGQNDILGYNQLNIAGPVKGQGIQGLIDLYQKFSPIANIMKLGKTGIETAQKYFADKKKQKEIEKAQEEAAAADAERAAMDAAYAAQSQASIDRQRAVTGGGRYDGAGSSAAYSADPTSYSGSSAQGGIQGYGGKSGTPVSQQRRPYGTGGIVTL